MTLNHNYGCFSGVGSGIAGNGRALRRQGFEKQMFGLITKSKIELQWMK